jgi:hypothetical protein
LALSRKRLDDRGTGDEVMSKLVRTALFALLVGGLAIPLAAQEPAAEPVAVPPAYPPPAWEKAPQPAPACPPSYRVVEEIVHQQVVRKVCKVVPEVKKHKKVVYCTKQEDYCLKKCPCPLGGGHGCDACPMCEQLRCRTVLLKKEVEVEEPSFKCVIECVVDVVPCKVFRVVPCGLAAPAAPHTVPPAKE